MTTTPRVAPTPRQDQASFRTDERVIERAFVSYERPIETSSHATASPLYWWRFKVQVHAQLAHEVPHPPAQVQPQAGHGAQPVRHLQSIVNTYGRRMGLKLKKDDASNKKLIVASNKAAAVNLQNLKFWKETLKL